MLMRINFYSLREKLLLPHRGTFMNDNQADDEFWQSLPFRKDRSQNELNGVAQLFQTALDPHHPMNKSTPTIFRTPFGNFNGDGIPTSFSSPILGMRNALFQSAIEPRIAPLVTLIKNLNLVTYSSCEGHLIEGDFYEAYVGFLYVETQTVVSGLLVQLAITSGFLPFRTWLADPPNETSHKTVEIYFPRYDMKSLGDYHEELTLGTSKLAVGLSTTSM